MLATFVLALPTIALVAGSFWVSLLKYLCVPVGTLSGLIVLRLGVRHGGRLLDRRWPEVMQAVSEKSA